MYLNPAHEFIIYPLPDTYKILKIKQKKVYKENNEKWETVTYIICYENYEMRNCFVHFWLLFFDNPLVL